MRDSTRAKRSTYSMCHWCDYSYKCNSGKCFKNKAKKTKAKNFLKREFRNLEVE